MKLKDPNETPVGGIWYQYQDEKGNTFRVNGYGIPLKSFTPIVGNHMKNNNVAVPENLAQLIEQQICERQPKGKCWIEPGDATKKVIHSFARVIDKTANKLGLPNPNLEKKASKCKTCGNRVNGMNRASRNLFSR